MSITVHLSEVTSNDIRAFDSDPSAAYRLILGDSLPARQSTSAQVTEWKKRNAHILLGMFAPGSLQDLTQEDRLVFDKAHLELGDISRRSMLQTLASTHKAPKKKPRLALEKSWHGIRYLLTGTANGGVPPLSWAVLGDKEIPDFGKLMGYGPARTLTGKQVGEVSKALSHITIRRFRHKFDLKKMQAAKVYAVNSNTDFDYLWNYFTKLKAFYSQVANAAKECLFILSKYLSTSLPRPCL